MGSYSEKLAWMPYRRHVGAMSAWDRRHVHLALAPAQEAVLRRIWKGVTRRIYDATACLGSFSAIP